jgi:MFS family permease
MSGLVRAAAFKVLRQPAAACFLLSRFAATLAWQMLTVAVGWHVYALTHDPLALGLVGLSEFLPFVSLVLVGGHLADRVRRRSVALTVYSIDILCALTLLVLTLEHERHAWPIYLVISVFGATRAFSSPAVQAMLPGLVSREDFPEAVALNSMQWQLATIGGPILGGVLYLIGPPVVFGACLLLFIATVALTVLIGDDTRPAAPPAVGSGRRFLEGLRFVVRNRLVLGVISLDLFAVLLGGAVALLPIYAGDALHTGPAGLGLLRAAPGIGAALAGVYLAVRPIRDHAGAVLLGGVVVFGFAMVVFGLSRSFPLSMAALGLSGAGDMLSVYVRGIVVQLNTPDAIRGRVSAVNSMFVGASNELGEFESGVTASWLGTVPSVVLGGVATVAVALSWAALFPALRRLRRLH